MIYSSSGNWERRDPAPNFMKAKIYYIVRWHPPSLSHQLNFCGKHCRRKQLFTGSPKVEESAKEYVHEVTSHLQASSLRRYQILPPTSRLYHVWLPSICIFHSNGFQKNMQMTVFIAFRVTQYIKQQKQKVFLLATLNLFCGLSSHHFLKRKLRIKTNPYFFLHFHLLCWRSLSH